MCVLQFFCDEHFLYTTFLGPYLPKDRPITVVDAGANIGLASILYSQVINFNGEVLAIEANPSTLQVRALEPVPLHSCTLKWPCVPAKFLFTASSTVSKHTLSLLHVLALHQGVLQFPTAALGLFFAVGSPSQYQYDGL